MRQKSIIVFVLILSLLTQTNSGPILGLLGYGGCMATCMYGGQSVKIAVIQSIKQVGKYLIEIGAASLPVIGPFLATWLAPILLGGDIYGTVTQAMTCHEACTILAFVDLLVTPV
jgi:hypothetical protein